MNAVEIQDLTYTYPGAAQPTLKHISLTISQGDFLAVVGNNGCGKSTLCKVLNGLIPHFITGSYQGSTKIHGLDTLQTDVGALARKVGYVYQDFENQIVRPTVLDDASFPVYGGEILGIAGISGNGQKELLEAIAGLQPAESGASIEYYAPDAAAPVQLVGKSPKAIREAGIHLSFVPEDRLGMGLVGSMGAGCRYARPEHAGLPPVGRQRPEGAGGP